MSSRDGSRGIHGLRIWLAAISVTLLSGVLVLRVQPPASPPDVDGEGTPSSAPSSGPTSSASPTGRPVAISVPGATPRLATTPHPKPRPTGNLPASIDATGATDASAGLNAYVRSVPDGSTIAFKAGGIYRMDHGLQLIDRHHLVFVGNGATLRAHGSGALPADSPFILRDYDTYITIKGFTLQGNNPDLGSAIFHDDGLQFQMGVAILGGGHIEIAQNTVRNTWGDGVFADASAKVGQRPDTIWIHDNRFEWIGRNGLGLVSALNVTAERNSYTQIGVHVLDVEPDDAADGVINVVFRNNTVNGYGLTPRWMGWLFSAQGADWATVRGITVTGNLVIARGSHNAKTVTDAGLGSAVRAAGVQDVIFTNNRSLGSGVGPVLFFSGVAGLTISGNHQPITSGTLASILNCTSVTYH